MAFSSIPAHETAQDMERPRFPCHRWSPVNQLSRILDNAHLLDATEIFRKLNVHKKVRDPTKKATGDSEGHQARVGANQGAN